MYFYKEMRILSSDEFQSLIEAGYESRRVEFKPPFSWNDEEYLWLREKAIQTMLALANTRDGGDIIIGIETKDDNSVELNGLNEKQISSFNYDLVKGIVDSFAMPGVNFDIAEGRYDNKRFIVVRVSEFDEIPVICKKDSQHKDLILRKGEIYCRSRSGPPATIRATEYEMREIIELAIDKGKKKLGERGYVATEQKSADLKTIFDKQIQDLIQ